MGVLFYLTNSSSSLNRIADYIEKEPEIKRKKELEKQDKQEKILKKETTKKILYDDQVYLKTHEKTMDDMKDTMAKGE